VYLLIILAILIMIYVVYQIKNKFKDEKRKDILLLQVIIFSLLVVQFVAGSWVLIILAVVFLIILAVCPKKFYNWIKITLKL